MRRLFRKLPRYRTQMIALPRPVKIRADFLLSIKPITITAEFRTTFVRKPDLPDAFDALRLLSKPRLRRRVCADDDCHATGKSHPRIDLQLFDKNSATPDNPEQNRKQFSSRFFLPADESTPKASPKTGIVACKTAARPEEIYCSLQKTKL